MQAHDQLVRFSQMQLAGPSLRVRFDALTSAHSFFQRQALKSISVSDALDDGSIEAVFLDVRIRFQIMMIFNDAFEPRGKVVCTHCHSAYGFAVQQNLGGFTFDAEGNTDLETCLDSPAIMLNEGAPQIILTFLERAMAANRRL
jgi:hypothetical protein